VDRATVVALVEVLDDGLPVGDDGVDDPGTDPEIGEGVIGQLSVTLLNLLLERSGQVRWEVDPDEPAPGIYCHGVQRKSLLGQTILLVEERRSPKTTVERVGPCVIGTLDGAPESA
jgi:hypothetical protein